MSEESVLLEERHVLCENEQTKSNFQLFFYQNEYSIQIMWIAHPATTESDQMLYSGRSYYEKYGGEWHWTIQETRCAGHVRWTWERYNTNE